MSRVGCVGGGREGGGGAWRSWAGPLGLGGRAQRDRARGDINNGLRGRWSGRVGWGRGGRGDEKGWGYIGVKGLCCEIELQEVNEVFGVCAI